jgi:hypothetical protein
MEQAAAMDMTAIYVMIGTIVVAQFGTIITVIVWLLKAAWKASEMNSDIARLKKDIDFAHRKLRLNGVPSDEDCKEVKDEQGTP